MKIVVNGCFGGFSISLDAARWMAERGHKAAIAEVAKYDAKIKDRNKQDEIERKYGPRWYGYGMTNDTDGYDRTDPILVAAVEALGTEMASGELAALRVVEIPDGVEWEIDEYDGREYIAEKHRTWY